MTTTTDNWRADALCAQTDPEAFYPDGPGGNFITIKRLCADCPVRQQCLDAAMAFEGTDSAAFRFGIWGGLSPRERWQLQYNARKAAA